MKLGEFKIIAHHLHGIIHIAYKNKAGILFTVTDSKPSTDGEGFTFHLGRNFTQATIHCKPSGKAKLQLVQPVNDDPVYLKFVDKDAFKKFIQTDYNGKLKP